MSDSLQADQETGMALHERRFVIGVVIITLVSLLALLFVAGMDAAAQLGVHRFLGILGVFGVAGATYASGYVAIRWYSG